MSGFPYRCHRTMAEVYETEVLLGVRFSDLTNNEMRRRQVLLALALRNNPTDAADDPRGAA